MQLRVVENLTAERQQRFHQHHVPGAERAAADALALLVDGVVRAVAGELALTAGAREILLSGRLLGVSAWADAFEGALARLAPVRRVGTLTQHAKHAAQGAAILADGLAGGQHAPIVQSLRLREGEIELATLPIFLLANLGAGVKVGKL